MAGTKVCTPGCFALGGEQGRGAQTRKECEKQEGLLGMAAAPFYRDTTMLLMGLNERPFILIIIITPSSHHHQS